MSELHLRLFPRHRPFVLSNTIEAFKTKKVKHSLKFLDRPSGLCSLAPSSRKAVPKKRTLRASCMIRGPEVAIGVLKAVAPFVCGTRHDVQRESHLINTQSCLRCLSFQGFRASWTIYEIS